MRNPFKKSDSHEFDEAIAACLAEMQTYGPGSEEYKAAFETMKGLTAMRELNRGTRISPDMIVMCGSNVLIVVLVGLIESKGYLLQDKWKSFTSRTR